jgi:excinuclease ABC subunit A
MPAQKKRTVQKKTAAKKRAQIQPRTGAPAGAIEIRGVWQNNLKGIDLDLPLNKLTVVTGPSGSGKSSLAFQTIYAEGQRRYVETFSPYTRQFFDRMDKPLVDDIRGIPPAIAIEQSNNVRTTRSTVGTITEINDYLKLFFPRVASGICPECGSEVRPETPKSVADKLYATWPKDSALVTFGIPVPPKTKPADFFEFLQGQGYLRVTVFGKTYRTDEPKSFRRKRLPAVVPVIQDRIRIEESQRARALEAIESAFHYGKGMLTLMHANSGEIMAFSRHWHCADCDITLREPSPSLFSFNNAIGACEECRGFGRTIGIDLDRAMPDKSLTINEGVVRAFTGAQYSECQTDLLRCCKDRDISISVPFEELSKSDQQWVIEGDGGDPDEAWRHHNWYGVSGFFKWLEDNSYKMHVRVFLSRFRAYTKCGTCKGARLKPEALHFRADGHTLPEWWELPVNRLSNVIDNVPLPPADATAVMLRDEIASRLRYLDRVGLGYLNLDRPTRTLSGGEVERVNLTTCLGASLVNTLFVLDEPSIGLHPRDTGRLIEVMHGLRDKGNTLLVVEHEEAVMRAADNVIDIGPGRGEHGGELIFQGTLDALLKKGAPERSLTRAYLTGKKSIPIPAVRRKPKRGQQLKIVRAVQNNLKRIDVEIPLGVFCCVTGVSGSGKSTLVHEVLFENLLRRKGGRTDNEPGQCRDLKGDGLVGQVIMVDQSPLSRTPRSTPAVYIGAFELIRKLFAETPDAKGAGIQMGYFSFNAGKGRCQRCAGNGFEKVEMQFLSDLYVRCPECEGTRYRPEVLQYLLDSKSIRDLLQMTVSEALEFFSAPDRSGTKKETTLREKIVSQFQVLADVGLTYLRLGQPLNTLSGGESQRLKLVGHLLGGKGSRAKEQKGDLLIFDEPTTGLHFDDIAMLLKVFHRLVDSGATVLVIEHNLEVIKNADHIIDLGPEAGGEGGEVVAFGTPEELADEPASHTGRYLRKVLGLDPVTARAAEESPAFRVLPKANQTTAIEIHGAREHNLKNIDVSIPRDSFVVVTGLSGSGKSTLAFDIIFAEGQRRFLDSMSPYARQFVQQLEKPDIDHITGLPPTVAIEQRTTRGGGKSTVSTVTEVYHFLRLMFAKLGTQYCPDCELPVEKQSLSAISTQIARLAKKGAVKVMAPVIKARKGFHTEVADWAGRQGFAELYVDGAFKAVEGFQKLARFKEHSIDAVVGAAGKAGPELDALVESALQIGKGTLRAIDKKGAITVFSSEMTCPQCDRSFEELDPRLFSFNSPHGWCKTCRGFGFTERKSNNWSWDHADSVLAAELEEEQRLGHAEESEVVTCDECGGARLNATALSVKVEGVSIDTISALPVNQAKSIVGGFTFSGNQAIIARDIMVEIAQRLRFLEKVGLGYLALDRAATTLSGGESQRIRLAAQLGSNLRGVLYVLDEPTIGLHPRDNERLLDTLIALRDKGNSLLVVEHDNDTMRRANHVLDLGPGAGMFGGEVVYNGPSAPLLKPGKKKALKDSPTAKALADPMVHPLRGERRKLPAKTAKEAWLRVKGAHANNLKSIEVAIPLERLTVITGISGSGKSSLMRGVIRPAAEVAVSKSKKRKPKNAPYRTVAGFELLGAVYEVDQSPIGKTSRSTPGTYVKVFDEIRKLFSGLPTARMRGYTASRFSFNTEGGRCEACKGNGLIKMEMTFLPTSYVLCDECKGARYNEATLEVEYNGNHIGRVMDMTIEEATAFFESNPKIHRSMRLLCETGLGYLKLGQPSPTLSGGEAQRIKLVTQLTRGVGRSEYARIRQNRKVKPNLYLIEEPTIGLHMADVRKLIDVLHALVDDGHTVIVIEHNTDIMAEADYILDIGPEAGGEGGKLVVAGTPETVAKHKTSRTAPFLKTSLRSSG